MHPSGFNWSQAWGISGTQQVGGGGGSATDGYQHALLWNGSPDSFIDLHQFLPEGFVGSDAMAIDSSGNIVGYATDSLGNNHAIIWEIPEPATILLFALSVPILSGLRKRR